MIKYIDAARFTIFSMIAIMWQFDVKDERRAEFEELYGVDGEWATMNRQTRSYLGSSFLRDQNRSSRYVVVEYLERDGGIRAAQSVSVRRNRGS